VFKRGSDNGEWGGVKIEGDRQEVLEGLRIPNMRSHMTSPYTICYSILTHSIQPGPYSEADRFSLT
jgi:hypothetical protein